MSYRIIIDSCGEFLEEWKKDDRFTSIPFVMTVDGMDIIDDDTFEQKEFLRQVAESPECPKSACPSPDLYLDAMEKEVADHIYVITISEKLSGSYNSAVLAQKLFLEEHPEQKIHVFNSASASIGETLIAMKIQEAEEENLSFDEIMKQVNDYIALQHTFFTLDNLETLRKNGRLSKTKAFVAGALKIKPIMGSNPDGSIQQAGQVRGMNKAISKMADFVVESVNGDKNRIAAISHCNCPERAEALKKELLDRMPWKEIVVLDTGGLSSMYANDGGIIVVA